MASPEDILDRMRRTRVGHRMSDFRKVLEYYGFEERASKARHGCFFRSPELARHEDKNVQMVMSWITIPNSCEDVHYLVPQVLERIRLVEQMRQHEEQDD